MNYGMQISASGALAALYRQDVYTNNLANASTAGFKPVMPTTRQRDAATVEDDLGPGSAAMLQRLGGGVHMAPNHVRHEQGSLVQSENPLDIAILGDGFLMVRSPSAGGEPRLSRDGRLTLDRDGRLVRASDGLPVLDASGGEITLPRDRRLSIDETGAIFAGIEKVATLGLVDVPDRSRMQPEGSGLFRVEAGVRREPASGTILQGLTEAAAVDEFDAMMKVAESSRAFGSNLTMIGYHDRAMEQAINTLGRVTA